MSRNLSGVYSLPPVYEAEPGETIYADQHNTPLLDIEADLNAARPISAGGTGATTASGAVTELGLGDSIVNDTNNNASFGINVRPDNFVNTGAPLIKGQGNTLVGSDIMTSANAIANYTVLVGPEAGENATNLYCVTGAGLRVLSNLVDGQYVNAFASDAGLHATYARNSSLTGAKAGLYKVDIQGCTIEGVSAACGGGTISNSVVVGVSAADAFTPASFALADADHHDFANCVVIGPFAARGLKADNNLFIGPNIASIVTSITGSFNSGVARSGFSDLTSGDGNTASGDGSGAGVTTGHFNTFNGFGTSISSGGLSNAMALGANAQADESNLAQIGDSALAKIKTYADIQPRTNGTQDIGASALRWKTSHVQQVSFPATQVASADVNTLDDYEEGTWTPSVAAVTGSITTSTASGTYTKIGNRVIFDVNVVITTNGTGATAIDVGLPPFAPAAASAVSGQNANTLAMIGGQFGASASDVRIAKYDGTYPAASGETLRLSGSFGV